jgi:hypothetical protein
MGMFDYICLGDQVAMPVPEEMVNFKNIQYQTKSLDNTLSCYFIENDGYLYVRENFYEEEDKKDLKEKKKLFYHGIIRFYAYETTDLVDYCADFDAKFTDGVLQDIKLINFKKNEHASRKQTMDRLLELQRNKEKSFSRKIGKFFHKFIFYPIFKFVGLPLARFRLTYPNFVLFYKPCYKEQRYGLYLEEISTGVCLRKTKYSVVFSFKVLGFGFVFENFKPVDF